MLEFWKVKLDEDSIYEEDPEMYMICASEFDLMSELYDRGLDIGMGVESKNLLGETVHITERAILDAIDDRETFDFVFQHAIVESGFDMVAFFRTLIIDIWPQLIDRARCNVETEIKLQDEYNDKNDEDSMSKLAHDRDILKMLQMDDATIVAYLIDCLRHVAKQLDSDHVDDTGFSIN